MRLPAFDRSKPFYPLVMNYVLQLIGFKEALAMARVLEMREVGRKVFPMSHFVEDHPFRLTVSAGVQITGYDIFYPAPREKIQELFPDLDTERILTHTAPFEISSPRPLRCKTQQDGIEIAADEVAEAFQADPILMAEAQGIAAGILLIAAHEATRGNTGKGATWEFLRHCRNAAAHGGSFSFNKGEPRRPASWRGLKIERGLQGKPLFGLPKGDGLLAPGDTILLLWDLEST